MVFLYLATSDIILGHLFVYLNFCTHGDPTIKQTPNLIKFKQELFAGGKTLLQRFIALLDLLKSPIHILFFIDVQDFWVNFLSSIVWITTFELGKTLQNLRN